MADNPPNDDGNTPPNPGQAPGEQGGDLDALPQWARDKLTKANGEAAKYRTRVRELEPLAAKAQEIEEAGKTEVQRLTEQVASLQSQLATSQRDVTRYKTAVDKQLPADLVDFLTGETEEDIASRADVLLARLGGGSSDTPPPADPPRPPRERLRPGAAPGAEPEETDLDKIGASIFAP